MRGFFVLLAMLLMAVPGTALAQGMYYADVDMAVGEDGVVSISGISNHPGLQDGENSTYTSKEGDRWMLNMSLRGMFSDYIFSLRLPQNSAINYIKSSGRIAIVDDDPGIVIEGDGSGKEFMVVIQYEIRPEDPGTELFYAPVAAIVAVAAIYLYWRRGRTQSRDMGFLTERQRKIVNVIEKHGKPVSQKIIEKESGIPKASVSRNIRAMERLGVLEIRKAGMSNAVYFRG